jgi:hypothetical protein
MTCPDTLSEGLGKILDRIAKMQITEWRGELLGALSRFQDGMTSRTVLASENEAKPHTIWLGPCRPDREDPRKKRESDGEGRSQGRLHTADTL